jgi:hypothetical protein
MRSVIAAALMLAPAIVTAAQARPDEVQIPFESHWYRVEVVLFERPGVTSDADGESLLDDAPRRYSVAARTLEEGDVRERFYPLDAATRDDPRLAPFEAPPADRAKAADPASDPAPPPSTPEEALRLATAEFESALRAQSFVWRPESELRLTDAARRLAATTTYRVLHHGAWIQAVADGGAAQPVLVQLGDAEQGVFELEGTLAVSLGRTPRLDAELWLQGDTPTPPDVGTTTPGTGLPAGAAVPAATPTEVAADAAAWYYVLHEDRQMNDGELHYLDHPRIGILARIDEVEPPAALRALAESLVGTPGGDAPE